jgi:GT2 family glycosyltransferase
MISHLARLARLAGRSDDLAGQADPDCAPTGSAVSRAVSVIVPTYNRARLLIATVEQVLRQDLEDVEVLVVDQSDPDQQAIVVDGLKRHVEAGTVRYLRLGRVGVANARNEGLARATGRVIVFLDDDVVLLNRSFLRAHVSCYDNPMIGGVCGRTIERFNRANARRTTNRITRSGRTLVNLLGHERCGIQSLKGANMSVRAEAIAGMDGFDRNYTGTALLEEADFSERILRRGWRFVFEPTAELLHLSAPLGGVRVGGSADTECFRFRSTAYFVSKHRGRYSLVAFAATHMAVAVVKAVKLRQVGLPIDLLRAAVSGFALTRRGPDHCLPILPDEQARREAGWNPGQRQQVMSADAQQSGSVTADFHA